MCPAKREQGVGEYGGRNGISLAHLLHDSHGHRKRPCAPLAHCGGRNGQATCTRKHPSDTGCLCSMSFLCHLE
jgi:hypothetical protein